MTGDWDSAAARSDVRSLAERHKVDLFRSRRRWAAEASPSTRQAWAPLGCREGIDYLICLHELGHVCSSLSRRLLSRNAKQEDLETRAACEAAAWAWGMGHAEQPVLALVSPHDLHRAASAWLSHVTSLAEGVPA